MVYSASCALPNDWVALISGGPISVGIDLASTTKKKSNPTAISVLERIGTEYVVRLAVRFKTEAELAIKLVLRQILTAIPSAQLVGLAVDASSEKLFARSLRQVFLGICPVLLIGGNDALVYGGEKRQAKSLLGELYVAAICDGIMALPPGIWVLNDHRSVYKEGGSFSAEVDAEGAHADLFDACKLALWAHLRGGGKVEILAVDTLSCQPPSGANSEAGYPVLYDQHFNLDTFNA